MQDTEISLNRHKLSMYKIINTSALILSLITKRTKKATKLSYLICANSKIP